MKVYFEREQAVDGNTSVLQIKKKSTQSNQGQTASQADVRCAADAGQRPKSKLLTSSAERGCKILPLLRYSPDLAPSDYYLLPKMKYELRRK